MFFLFVVLFVCLFGGLLFLHTELCTMNLPPGTDSNVLRDPNKTPKYSDTINPTSHTVLWEWACITDHHT